MAKIKWKPKGFYRLRSEPGVVAELERRAAKIAARANSMGGTDGYKTSSVQGRRRPQGRWRTTVITANAEAMRDNAENNTLTRALYS